MTRDLGVGLLLPHFGPEATPAFLRKTVALADDLSFDSLWARDHLYIPAAHRDHGGIQEGQFLESTMTLAAASAVAGDVTLGTSVANAHRHPLKLSQAMGTLDHLAAGDVVCGVGAGTFRGEFDAVCAPFEDRGALAEETMAILRRTFTEEEVTFEGEHYAFEDVTIDPRPGEDVPIWYGGLSPVAVRRAVEYADGWVPGRMPYDRFERLLGLLSRLETDAGRELDVGYVTIYSVAETDDAALDNVNVEGLIEDANELLPGEYRTREDVEGCFVAGSPASCADTCRRLYDMGVGHLVLDARHAFDRLHEMMVLTADEVFPLLP